MPAMAFGLLHGRRDGAPVLRDGCVTELSVLLQPISGPIEFLQDYFPGIQQLATAIFLKGYQWPFNRNELKIIDLH